MAAKRSSPAKPVTTPKSPASPRPNVVAQARGKATPRRSSSWWETLKSFLGAVLIFLVVRAFLVEAFRIPSPSMVPSLLVGDWLFVNKLIYGPNVPFTPVNLPGYAEPQRREVAVFVSPYQPDEAQIGNDPTPTLVKRIAGVPGDTLYMRDGLLHVNGVPLPQRDDELRNPEGNPLETSWHFEWQGRFGLSDTRFGSAPENPTLGNWGPLLIPDGHFFMLGDNRYQSKDSRYWGLVPRQNLRGRPLFVYYSWNAERGRPFGFLRDIRWERIGHRIR